MAQSLNSHWMEFAIVSAVFASLAIAIAGIAFSIQSWLLKKRLRRFHELELVPNILLTRHPILFVGRRRSLFRLGGDFLELPVYLSEHGFQVEEVELETHDLSPSSLIRSISSLLKSDGKKTHLFLPVEFLNTAYDLAFEGHPQLASLTVVGTSRWQKKAPLKLDRLQLRPPRIPLHLRPDLQPTLTNLDFHTERLALDHLVSLAESDLR